MNENAFTKDDPSSRLLRRTRDDKMIAGVCAGAARFLGVDANIVRLALGVFTLFGGSGIAIYAIGWLLIPEEGQETSIAQNFISKHTAKA